MLFYFSLRSNCSEEPMAVDFGTILEELIVFLRCEIFIALTLRMTVVNKS